MNLLKKMKNSDPRKTPDVSETRGLFPTPVLITKKEKPLSLKERDFLLNLKYRPNAGNVSTEDTEILENEKLQNLKKWIYDSVNKFFNDIYQPAQDVQLRITQSWCNLSAKGQYHHEHAHPNSFISGVYYVQTNDDDRIQFVNRPFSAFQIEAKDWNPFNSPTWWLPTEENSLILFPSTLNHCVPTVQGEKDRISLSFNTFPQGFLGRDDSLTGVKV
jgi:uncharacterized protein (TIGR02466 family)